MKVRDHGLLESALARPQASAFGQDAYQNLDDKAYDLVIAVASGILDDVGEIVGALAPATTAWPS